ncbi:MAG: hypothetical protein DRQ88_09320 [Epsilonproteobacteria bacterium]|nr:MAG: hypothetical protein DRQ88_09320 [Campylobacterota bacterium]
MTLDQEIINLYYAKISDGSGKEIKNTISWIAGQSNVPVNRVRTLIFGKDETGNDPTCPYYLKKHHGESIPIKKYQELKGQLFLQVEANALALLQKAIKVHLESDAVPSIQELKSLSGLISDLDKIGRLEEGRPTDIKYSVNFSPEKILEIIHNDPMYVGKKRRMIDEKEKENKSDNEPRIES